MPEFLLCVSHQIILKTELMLVNLGGQFHGPIFIRQQLWVMSCIFISRLSTRERSLLKLVFLGIVSSMSVLVGITFSYSRVRSLWNVPVVMSFKYRIVTCILRYLQMVVTLISCLCPFQSTVVVHRSSFVLFCR